MLNIDMSMRVPNTMKTISSVQHLNLKLSKHIPTVYGQLINTKINWSCVYGHNIWVSSNFKFNPLELLF